jgi:acyl CoA:acetate/3-ketoacid CoA transferase alpha subunit
MRLSFNPQSPQNYDISLKKAQAAVAAHYGSNESVAIMGESSTISSKAKSKFIEVDIVPQETVQLLMAAGGEAMPLLTFNIASHEEIYELRLSDYTILKEEFFQLVKLAVPLVLSYPRISTN